MYKYKVAIAISLKMADFWTTEKVTELIDMYKQYSCLYNTKDKDYHNRNLRSQAISNLAKAMGCEGNYSITSI